MTFLTMALLANGTLANLIRLAEWMKCLPVKNEESEGSYKHRVMLAVLRKDKLDRRKPKE